MAHMHEHAHTYTRTHTIKGLKVVFRGLIVSVRVFVCMCARAGMLVFVHVLFICVSVCLYLCVTKVAI